MDILKELLTKYNYEEIAEQLKISSRTVRRWEKHGRIKYTDLKALKELLELHKQNDIEQSRIVEG